VVTASSPPAARANLPKSDNEAASVVLSERSGV
jgi:hypothetical protein